MNNNPVQLQPGDALLVVDVQNDFLPGGSLAVPNGDEIIPVLNRCIHAFVHKNLTVAFSRDWHPVNHHSFVEQGGVWPRHCIATSIGADFAAGLKVPDNALIISKATTPTAEAYSAFHDTDLAQRLHTLQVQRLFVAGLATDYCVRASVIDALANGFVVIVMPDAVRAVELQPGDSDRAFQAMTSSGAILCDAESILAHEHLHHGIVERVVALTHHHH